MNIIDAALDYAAHGCPVVPLWGAEKDACFCPDGMRCSSPGKHPRPELAPQGVHDATLSQTEIASWPDDINIGIALGKAAGGRMVFDVDDSDTANELIHPTNVLSDRTGGSHHGTARYPCVVCLPGRHVYISRPAY